MGLTIAVTIGEYIGGVGLVFNKKIWLDLDQFVAGSGRYYKDGDWCDPLDTADFKFSDQLLYSLYGTGTEAGGGWANIKNSRAGTGTILATDLSSIWFGTTEVAVADIAEIPVGVAV